MKEDKYIKSNKMNPSNFIYHTI